MIVGNSKDPRTRHPEAFTANCPHRDSGMKKAWVCLPAGEWSCSEMRQGSAQAVRVRNV